MNNRWYILIAIYLGVLLSTNFAVSQTHKGINFQGVIKIPTATGYAYPTQSGISVNAKILSTNNCILLEEEFVGVNISKGYINLSLGTGNRLGSDQNFTFQKVMDNSSIFSSLTCLHSDGTVNAAVSTFDPAGTGSNGSRKLRLELVANQIPVVADFNMRSVAYAVNSETLNGKTENAFINVNAAKSVTQSVLEDFFSSSSMSQIVAGNYNAPSATTAVSVTGAVPAAQVSGLSPIATSGSYNDLTNKPTLGTASALDVAAAGNANATQIVKGDDTRLTNAIQPSTTLGGDLSGTLPNPIVEGFKNQSISAAGSSAGQVLKFMGGSVWTPGFITMFDLRSTVTGTQAFGGVGCLSHQTLTWTSATDNLTCTNISIGSAQVTGLATSATVDATNAANISSGVLNIGRLPASVVDSLWTEASGSIHRPTGNVGIGAPSGGEKLEVAGKVKAENIILVDTTAAEGGACVDGSIGKDASGNIYICN